MATEFDSYNYIISIDIGTTFSGSCFSYIQDRKSIVHIIKWPEQSDQDTFEKTPTACLYSDNKLIKWGKAAIDHITAHPNDPNVTLIDQFKLKLQDIFQQQRLGTKLSANEIKYRNATVDYLREIYLYTCHQLIQTVPHQVSEEEFRFVLTVPATWVSGDNLEMQKIAIEAGLIKATDPKERLVVINEALAASLFCEREYCIKVDGRTKKLVKGQRYLVCDAGGGTVDLATYECTGSDNTTKTGRVEAKNGHCQLALESGGLCGSTILDRNMERYLKDQVFLGSVSEVTLKSLVDQFIKEIKHYFGGESGKNNYIQPVKLVKRDSATTLATTEDTVMNDIKENDYDYEAEYEQSAGSDIEDVADDLSYYDDDDYLDQDIFNEEELTPDLLPSDYIYFTLPEHDKKVIPSVMEGLKATGNIIQSVDFSQLRIKNTDVAKYVFDPVIEQVIKLIRKQIQKSHTTIESLFLLGGFGQSPYLYKKLHYEFITCTNSIKHLIVPEDGYRASMRGGIYYGIDCIGIIPEMHFRTVDGFYCERPIYKENYNLLVAIDINLFDLSAVYSFVELNMEEEYKAKPPLTKVFDQNTAKSMFSLFLDYQFDSTSFITNKLNGIMEIVYERILLAKNISPNSLDLHTLTDCDTKIYYDILIGSFVHQMFEHIQNDYETIYQSRSWYRNDVRYSISIAPNSIYEHSGESFSGMDGLFRLLSESLNVSDRMLSYEKNITVEQYLRDLFTSNAYPSTKLDMKTLEYYVFHAADEVGMANETFKGNNNILWTEPTFGPIIPPTLYKYFAFTTNETAVRKSSNNKYHSNESSNRFDGILDRSICGKDVACQVLSFNLNFSRQNMDIFTINNEKSEVFWEYQNLSANEVDSEIDKGKYTFKKLANNLVGIVDFMCPQFYRYIQTNMQNYNRHTFGDLFLIHGTDKVIDMKPENLNVNIEGLHHAIRRFRNKEINGEEILDTFVKPWIKYRLTPMIINACDYNQSNELHLVFTGETINVRPNGVIKAANQSFVNVRPDSSRAAKHFINLLEDNLREHFGKEVPIYYVSEPRYIRHIHCLINGFYSQESLVSKRVTERRYAIHVLNHDVKKEDDTSDCTYSQTLKKKKESSKKKIGTNKKAKIQDDESKEEAEESIVYTFRGEGLTLLHPIIEFNEPISSIGSFKNPLLELKVSHKCSIALVLYGSEKENVTDYSISDNSFKKLHRFIFPIKDVTQSIQVSCVVEKYGLVFTVKQDDYEADYLCPDYLKLN